MLRVWYIYLHWSHHNQPMCGVMATIPMDPSWDSHQLPKGTICVTFSSICESIRRREIDPEKGVCVFFLGLVWRKTLKTCWFVLQNAYLTLHSTSMYILCIVHINRFDISNRYPVFEIICANQNILLLCLDHDLSFITLDTQKTHLKKLEIQI